VLPPPPGGCGGTKFIYIKMIISSEVTKYKLEKEIQRRWKSDK